MRKGLRQFFSYFGSKTNLAKEYPEPEHGTIIEPFAGSAGYSCLHFEKDVFLFDKDPTIVGVWEYLIRATKSDILSLPLSESDIGNLSQGEQDFIRFWFVRGRTEPAKPNSSSPWMRSGKYDVSFWSRQTRERISEQVDKINHWKIALSTYSDIPNSRSTWFIDPPYIRAGKRYKCGSKQIDYDNLSEWCKSREGQIIVCEEASATWLPFSSFREIRTLVNKPFREGVYIDRN